MFCDAATLSLTLFGVDPKSWRSLRDVRSRKLETAASKDFSESIELNPRDAHAHNQLAWLLATCPDDNYRDGTKAKSESMGALAAAYAETGDWENAIKRHAIPCVITPNLPLPASEEFTDWTVSLRLRVSRRVLVC
jgi:hypothetical protein